MAEVGFNSQNLSGISQSFAEKSQRVQAIKEQVTASIARMKGSWTGDASSIAGRDKDFIEILNNLEVIEKNIYTIAKFLDEKNTDFSQVTYK